MIIHLKSTQYFQSQLISQASTCLLKRSIYRPIAVWLYTLFTHWILTCRRVSVTSFGLLRIGATPKNPRRCSGYLQPRRVFGNAITKQTETCVKLTCQHTNTQLGRRECARVKRTGETAGCHRGGVYYSYGN